MKYLFIIIDGLGDRHIEQLGGTPLEAAHTPNMDYLAEHGICGMIQPVFTTALPTSEECHFSLFGYDPNVYRIRRGYFTASGAGFKLKKSDVGIRANFGTIDEEFNMIDRRAGRIDNTHDLIKDLNMEIDGVKFMLKYAGGHRIALALRGKGLDSNICDGDPHYGSLGKKVRKISALKEQAEHTADVLNKFLQKSHEILKNHEFNKGRKIPANYILTRGASMITKLPSFKDKYGLKAACIAGKALYKQIAEVLGMKLIQVKGADGSANTDLEAKVSAAKKALNKHDFVFLHIKATDSLGEDGNCIGKKQFIEKIDKYMKFKDIIVIITADHSTPCELKRHSDDPVPFLIYGRDKDNICKFSEKECSKGQTYKAIDFLSKIVRINKRLK